MDAKTLAIIGASNRPGSPGQRVLEYLERFGYAGEVFAINPRLPDGDFYRSYPDVRSASRNGVIDHALLLVPAHEVSSSLRSCVEEGVRSASIFATGTPEDLGLLIGGSTAASWGRGIRVLGPNSLGMANFHSGLIATPSSALMGMNPVPGPVSILSQSGSVGAYLMGMLSDMGIGMRFYVSVGNQTDIRLGEFLSYAARDRATTVVVVYAEGVRDAQAFVTGMAELRAAGKHVIVLKGGTTDQASQAVVSHTGAAAGDEAVYEAVIRDAGAVRVESLSDAAAAAAWASSMPALSDSVDSIAALSPSGGFGVLIADALHRWGMGLTEAPSVLQDKIRTILPYAAATNPFDLGGHVTANPQAFGQAIEMVLADGSFDAAIVSFGNLSRSPMVFSELASGVTEALENRRSPVPVVVHGVIPPTTERVFAQAGVPCTNDPARAARLLAIRNRVAQGVRRDSRVVLEQPGQARRANAIESSDLDGFALLADSGISVPRHWVLRAGEKLSHAGLRSAEFPLVAKRLEPGVVHKSDRGMVRLNLSTPRELSRAISDLSADDSREFQILVQEMITWDRVEILVGCTEDPTFGRSYVIGFGGKWADLYSNHEVIMPPLSSAHVSAALQRLDSHGLLRGYRGDDAAHTGPIIDTLLRLESLLRAHPEIVEIELNPLLIRTGAVSDAVAVDVVLRTVVA